jgi:hypothetical protein
MLPCLQSWAIIGIGYSNFDAVNSLITIDCHDHQLCNKLLCRLVTPPNVVLFQRFIARENAELFSSNHYNSPFYAAFCFDELSRGSILCLNNNSFETAIS